MCNILAFSLGIMTDATDVCAQQESLFCFFFRDIIHRFADVMLLFGFMHVGDATAVRNNIQSTCSDKPFIHQMSLHKTCIWRHQGVAAGVLRGAGKQLIGALCNLVGLYVIGFPIGLSLMFAAHMGIVGKTKLLGLVPPSWLLIFRKATKAPLSFLCRSLDRTHHL